MTTYSTSQYIALPENINKATGSMRFRLSPRWILSATAVMLVLFAPLLVFDCEYCFSSKLLVDTANADLVDTANADSTALLRHGATAAVVASPTSDRGEGEIVVVTGATGRLGSKLYFELQRLKQQQRIQTDDNGNTNDDTDTTTTSNNIISEVRAVVRNLTKARTILGCTRCDESEGIYLANITDPNGLDNVMGDGKVTVLAIAAGSSPYATKDEQRAVEFDGVVNSVRSLAMNSGNRNNENDNKAPKVILCSSMGTAGPLSSDSFGNILHLKLNAEAFLSTAGLPSYIVKPCGLKDDLERNYTLYTGIFDAPSKYFTITRDNVAHVMAEAVIMPTTTNNKQHGVNELHQHYRFDLCSKPGTPTEDFRKLIEDSRWEWEKK